MNTVYNWLFRDYQRLLVAMVPLEISRLQAGNLVCNVFAVI